MVKCPENRINVLLKIEQFSSYENLKSNEKVLKRNICHMMLLFLCVFVPREGPGG